MNRQHVIILALVILLFIPGPALAASGWEVIWEADFILDEPPGAHEGYFLVGWLQNWPNGLLRQEIRVEYLEGDNSAGSVISFHVIRCPPEGGWSEWSIGCYLESPAEYHECIRFFETAPNAAGIVYDGREATGHCHARVNMRLLRPVYRTSLPLVRNE